MLNAVALTLVLQGANLHITPEKRIWNTDESPTFQVELTNKGRKPLNLLKVSGESASHMINPLVGWSVLPEGALTKHPSGTPMVTLTRCGHMNLTTDDMFQTLASGEKAKFSFWPVDFDAKKPGKYRIVFYYEVDPNKMPMTVADVKIPNMGGLPTSLLPKYRSLTPLKLVSNEVRFEIRAKPEPTSPEKRP